MIADMTKKIRQAPAATPKAARSVSEFLAAFGLSRTRLYDEINSGRLRVMKVGNRTLVSSAAESAWINLCEAEAKLCKSRVAAAVKASADKRGKHPLVRHD
jgi:hypothetical protein